MAIRGSIPVEFGTVFPDGAYAAGPVEKVRDFERSRKDEVIQQLDKDSGLPLWVVEVIDAQEDARQRTVKVKIAAQVQPLLPDPVPGSPFTPVEFDGHDRGPLRGLLPLPGHRPVQRPGGVLTQGHRRPRPGAGPGPPGS